MTRRHPPTLVDPVDTVRGATDRQLGITSRQSLDERVAALERLLARRDADGAQVVQAPAPDELAGWEIDGVTGPITIAAQTAAGTTATVANFSGNDEAGLIQLIPGGTGITTGVQAIITFALPRPSTDYAIVLWPASSAARTAGTTVGPTSRSVSGWSLTTGTALSSGSTYQWFYFVRQYK